MMYVPPLLHTITRWDVFWQLYIPSFPRLCVISILSPICSVYVYFLSNWFKFFTIFDLKNGILKWVNELVRAAERYGNNHRCPSNPSDMPRTLILVVGLRHGESSTLCTVADIRNRFYSRVPSVVEHLRTWKQSFKVIFHKILIISLSIRSISICVGVYLVY